MTVQDDICIFFGTYSSWHRESNTLTIIHRLWLALIFLTLDLDESYNRLTRGMTTVERDYIASILHLIHPFDPAAERKLFRMVMPEWNKFSFEPLTVQQAASIMLDTDLESQLAIHRIIFNSVCLYSQIPPM